MGLFFIASGTYLVTPLAVIWIAFNVDKGYKRFVALGAISCFANVGSFVGTNIFLRREEPKYRTGFSTNLGLCGMGMAAATVLFICMFLENKARKKERKDLANTMHPVDVERLPEKNVNDKYYL